jgi:hypothetical protein
MRKRGQIAAGVIAGAVWLALPGLADACATCFGDPASSQTQGMNNAILMLLGIVGVVYVGVGKLFWDFRKRSKRLEEQQPARQRLRLIHGGKL